MTGAPEPKVGAPLDGGGRLAHRVGAAPLLTPADIPPLGVGFEVQAVLNPGAARIGDEILLLMRVAERARGDIDPPPDARTLDLSGPHPKIVPLRGGYRCDDVVPIAVRDPDADSAIYVPLYIPKETPGLDISDPRSVMLTNLTLGTTLRFPATVSHLRCARSSDGIHFTVDPQAAIFPSTDLDEFGCEDARATCIDGVWHITYTAVSRVGITPSLALTRDFRTFEKHGAIGVPDQKDLALFPEKRSGGYMALMRPMPSSFGHVLGIWIAMPDPLLPWGLHRPLVLPREGKWDERQTGAGTVPFLTDAGWLEIYHGADANLEYALGAVLLDRDDPCQVIGRSDAPILKPEASYERGGLFPNVVFACGHIALDDEARRIRVFYGASDTVVAAADFDVREILDSLRPPDAPFGHS